MCISIAVESTRTVCALDTHRLRLGQQASLKALPGRSTDGGDRGLRHRFPRKPACRIEPREAPRRRRVLENEGQLPVPSLAQMQQHRAMQPRFAGQPVPAAARVGAVVEIGDDRIERLLVNVQPPLSHFDIVGDGVFNG